MSTEAEMLGTIPTCHGGLENLDDEFDYWCTDIEGRVPSDLRGTFFRNGPGRQRIGGKPYGHWFDGDGMVCAFTFIDGRVHFRNRYVRTPKYIDETASQSVCYRCFGTQIPGGWTKNAFRLPANPANTNTIYHGGHLLALNEGGRPWELDAETLDTIGEFNYAGALDWSQVFSAHGRIHPATGDYINFGAGATGLRMKPCLNLYRINPQGRMVHRNQIPLKYFPFCHDFVITDRYAVFFLGSIALGNMLPVFLGMRSIAEQIRFDRKINLQILVCDLNTLSVTHRFETEPGVTIHFGNAYERGDQLVVDAMYADNFEANEALRDVFNPASRFGGASFRRYTLDLSKRTMRFDQVTPVESEFPTFNRQWTGQPNRVTYTACSIPNGANSFFNGIQRIEDEGRSQQVVLDPGLYGSEPLFVASRGATREDDGYLMEVVYDAWNHRSELRVLRADELTNEVCRIRLPHHLPHQFHGFFTPEVLTGVS